MGDGPPRGDAARGAGGVAAAALYGADDESTTAPSGASGGLPLTPAGEAVRRLQAELEQAKANLRMETGTLNEASLRLELERMEDEAEARRERNVARVEADLRF